MKIRINIGLMIGEVLGYGKKPQIPTDSAENSEQQIRWNNLSTDKQAKGRKEEAYL